MTPNERALPELPSPVAYKSGIDKSFNDASNSTTFRWFLEMDTSGRRDWPKDATLYYTADQMRAYATSAVEAALAERGDAVVTDEMVERACKRYAFREDGAVFPDAYSEYEVLAERALMREFLTHVLTASPPAAVPVDALRGLVEKWRALAVQHRHFAGRALKQGDHHQSQQLRDEADDYDERADELAALLDRKPQEGGNPQ